MKKWRNRVAPDDASSWADVSGMWPTPHGSYEVADFFSSSSSLTATGETTTTGKSAWAFNVLSGSRAYVIGSKIWEYSGGTLTDRTGGLAVSGGHMAQYGNVTLLARSTSATLASSTGGNFSAVAGSPQAQIVVVQSNAVVCFNTSVSSDGWAASDVGDYTNWTTGESASGRILEHNGQITAAVPFGNDIIVFKADAIFRMTYVGGTVKWVIHKLISGVGCPYGSYGSASGQVSAEACGDSIIFLGRPATSSLFNADRAQIYKFDGTSAPILINPELDIDLLNPIICYDPSKRRVFFLDYNAAQVIPYYYHLDYEAWGRGNNIFSAISTRAPLVARGDYTAVMAQFGLANTNTSTRPILASTTDAFELYLPVAPGGSTALSAYVTTTKTGRPDKKTSFSRCTPLMRRRVNNSAGSPAVSLDFELYRELHDTTAQSTRAITESTARKRFDLLGGAATDNFARFKLTFTDMDVEIDDALIEAAPAGTD